MTRKKHNYAPSSRKLVKKVDGRDLAEDQIEDFSDEEIEYKEIHKRQSLSSLRTKNLFVDTSKKMLKLELILRSESSKQSEIKAASEIIEQNISEFSQEFKY